MLHTTTPHNPPSFHILHKFCGNQKYHDHYREDEQIFAYTRKQDQEKLLTVCNFSDKNVEVEVPEEFKGAECLITNLGRKEFEGKIVLNPYEAFVLYYKH